MKWSPKLFVGSLALATVLGLAAAEPAAVAGDFVLHIDIGTPAQAPVVYHYVYYPEAEVYYVPETRVYWWLSGGTWISGPHVPAGLVLGESIRLNVDAPEPWHHHEIVVKHYPGHRHEHRHHDRD